MCEHDHVAAEKVRFSKILSVTSAKEYVNYINCVKLRIRLQHQTDLTPTATSFNFHQVVLFPERVPWS